MYRLRVTTISTVIDIYYITSIISQYSFCHKSDLGGDGVVQVPDGVVGVRGSQLTGAIGSQVTDTLYIWVYVDIG